MSSIANFPFLVVLISPIWKKKKESIVELKHQKRQAEDIVTVGMHECGCLRCQLEPLINTDTLWG